MFFKCCAPKRESETLINNNNKCVFCEIAQKRDHTRVIYQDEIVVAFEDIKPQAKLHYLVIPREHIRSVHQLSNLELHLNVLRRMKEVGEMLLQRNDHSGAHHIFGFHRPPFTSVDHLHLHCIAPPFKSFWRKLLFVPSRHFIALDQVFTSIDTKLQ